MKMRCKDCGYEWEDESVKVCSNCGSDKYSKVIVINDHVFTEPTERRKILKIKSSAKIPKIKGKKRRSEFELEKMDDPSEMYGKIVDRQQVHNRKADIGREIITDKQTGEVLYEKEYVLSGHKGHGTEKVIAYNKELEKQRRKKLKKFKKKKSCKNWQKIKRKRKQISPPQGK